VKLTIISDLVLYILISVIRKEGKVWIKKEETKFIISRCHDCLPRKHERMHKLLK
jgi:tRNA(Phe) wybutosine-synthesizing methylase Tyw3